MLSTKVAFWVHKCENLGTKATLVETMLLMLVVASTGYHTYVPVHAIAFRHVGITRMTPHSHHSHPKAMTTASAPTPTLGHHPSLVCAYTRDPNTAPCTSMGVLNHSG